MLPAKSFYDRVLWDPSEDTSLYTICYEDRPTGVVEVTFGAFVPAEVPWHRIRQFRCGGRVVWEREAPVKTRSVA